MLAPVFFYVKNSFLTDLRISQTETGRALFFTHDTKEGVDKGYKGKVLLLELGIGMNTPGIIKYPFWQYTSQNKNVTYSCINMVGNICANRYRKSLYMY